MRLKPYPEYNDSQVDWLGDVPKHWTVQPATAISRVITSTVDKKSYEGEIPVRLCNYTDVYYNDEVRDNPEYMKATATPAQIALFTPKAGDVAITKDSETSDDIGIPSYAPLDMPGIVFGYHLAIYRPEDKRYGRFLKYLFESKYVKVTFENKTPGVTRVGLSQNTLKYLRIPTPPVQEAQAIADYLDRETTEIDAFITDQEELITLLRERRTTAISRAVVTGLNSDAPMNDSQVDWLGDVPKHWTVQPATAISRVITSTVDKKSYEGEIPVRLCNYTDVYYNDEVRDNPEYMKATATPAQIALFTPKAGDVAITKDSETSDDIGIPSYAPLDMPGIVFGYHLAIYRPEDKRYGRFLKYLFESKYVKVTFENKTPGVTRVGLSQNTLKYLRIPTPPVQEAQAIADYLDRETTEIDAAIADAREAIRLSKERRAAVISAAVTGKIDVRGALAPATKKVEAEPVGVA